MASKAKVFDQGGSISILKRKGELKINSATKRLIGEISVNNNSIFIEGQVSTENGVLRIKDLGIRNKAGDYNNIDLVN